MRIGIIAALPGELKPLVQGWKRLPTTTKGVFVWRRPGGEDEVLAACAGMGKDAALRAFAAAETGGSLDLVLSVGWAGALIPEEKIGLAMSEIVDAQTGERFRLTDGKRKMRVVTTAYVADRAEKRRLFETYGAVAVDMEAATVARLAQMRGIPMCCFKAISDEADANLPDINPYIDANGQLRLAGFLVHVALRPQSWGSLLQMGKRSSNAAKQLADAVNRFLAHKDYARVNRTGGI